VSVAIAAVGDAISIGHGERVVRFLVRHAGRQDPSG
jgi:hypothetical protein